MLPKPRSNVLGSVGVVNAFDLNQAGLGVAGVSAAGVAQVATPGLNCQSNAPSRVHVRRCLVVSVSMPVSSTQTRNGLQVRVQLNPGTEVGGNLLDVY